MNWILLTIIAVTLWASTNILDKYILSKLVKEPILPLISIALIGIVVSPIIFMFHPGQPMTLATISIALLAGVFYMVGIFLYFKAVMIEDISKVIALWYVNPLFTVLFGALLLQEILRPTQYAGIAFLILGALMIEMKEFKFTFSKGFLFILTSSVIFALYYVLTKIALQDASYWTVFAWGRIGTFVSTIPLVYFKRDQIRQSLVTLKKQAVFFMSASEFINIVGMICITAAAATQYVTLVNGLSTIQPLVVLVMTLFLSRFFPGVIQEEATKKILSKKSIAIICIVLGAWLLV